MAYVKQIIDNPTCSRRFHVTFDDEGKKVPVTEVKCSYCGVTVLSRSGHPEVALAREENLTKSTMLSEQQVKECRFVDKMTGQRLYPDAPSKPL